MAAYPNTDFLYSSRQIQNSGRIVRRSKNGRLRIISPGSGLPSVFTLRHFVSKTELDTLLDFHKDNRGIPFDLTFDGDTFSCQFTSDPLYDTAVTGAVTDQKYGFTITCEELNDTGANPGAESAFPFNTDQKLGTKLTPTGGYVVFRSAAGFAQVKNDYTRDAGRFDVKLRLTSAQITTLVSHYNQNLLNKFDFIYEGNDDTYRVVYGSTPVQTQKATDTKYDVTVGLEVHRRIVSDNLLLNNGADRLVLNNKADTLVING